MKTYPIETIYDDGKTIGLFRTCPFCGKEWKIQLDSKLYHDGLERYDSGVVAQKAFPTFTDSEREFIITGICDECWKNI